MNVPLGLAAVVGRPPRPARDLRSAHPARPDRDGDRLRCDGRRWCGVCSGRPTPAGAPPRCWSRSLSGSSCWSAFVALGVRRAGADGAAVAVPARGCSRPPALTQFLMAASIFATAYVTSQYFQISRGDSPLGTGLRFLPWTMTPLLVAPLAGKLVDRIGCPRARRSRPRAPGRSGSCGSSTRRTPTRRTPRSSCRSCSPASASRWRCPAPSAAGLNAAPPALLGRVGRRPEHRSSRSARPRGSPSSPWSSTRTGRSTRRPQTLVRLRARPGHRGRHLGARRPGRPRDQAAASYGDDRAGCGSGRGGVRHRLIPPGRPPERPLGVPLRRTTLPSRHQVR